MKSLRVVSLTKRALGEIAPAVDEEMHRWERAARSIPDAILRHQALSSQTHKRFHAAGGSVFALLAPGRERDMVTLIVALQTISDYLDNLCDRTDCQDRQAYRHLHRAMLDAVDPSSAMSASTDYYRYYPYGKDAGYLYRLVATCRDIVAKLPAYGLVRAPVRSLLQLYTDLQVHKHGPVPSRVPRLRSWFDAHRHRWPSLYWWEFAAATGSTLGVFALLAAAASPNLSAAAVDRLLQAYFPWIGAWHILLDYLIDLEEDFHAGDLNLVSPYADAHTRRERLTLVARRALQNAASLPDAAFHVWIVQGLPALYLSDQKVQQLGLGHLARHLLTACGPTSRVLHFLFRVQRHPLGRRWLPSL